MKLQLCIAGCGRYARTILDGIQDMTDIVELYFASRDASKAKRYCEDYGGSGYFGGFKDAARDSRIDAMYFLTPHDLHLENAKLAAAHGKHILMEKPVARTLEEARHLIQAAEDGGVKLMVAENFRFLPNVAKCKQLIADGSIGQLRSVQVLHEGYDTGAVDWRTNAERNGGGRFIDGGIHFVDILLNLAGFPESVYAVFESPKVLPEHEGEDGILMTASLPEGVTGLLHYSGGTSVAGTSEFVKVTGTSGVLSFVPDSAEVNVETRDGKTSIQIEPARVGIERMVREFRDCIRQDREPVMSGGVALDDLAVVLAAYRSAEQGTPVKVAPS